MDTVIYIDEDDRELGVVPRKIAHKEGLLHRVVIVYVFDKDGNILVQERADGRFDHSSAGHVDPGETYLEAAMRELGEELGIFNVPLKEISTLFVEERLPKEGKHKRHLFMVYSCLAAPVKLQEEEVKGVHWADPVEVFEKIQSDSLCRAYTRGFAASLPIILKMQQAKGVIP